MASVCLLLCGIVAVQDFNKKNENRDETVKNSIEA